MEWTKDLPEEEGYYWTRGDGYKDQPFIVKVILNKSNGLVYDYGDEEPFALEKFGQFMRWFGPLPTPEFVNPMEEWRAERNRNHDLRVPETEIEFNRDLVERLTKEAIG